MSNLALVKKDTVDVVATKVREFQERGELHFPENYSPDNAMKAAWLIMQSTNDRNGKPALEVCTRDSVANALLDMVVQGLNPSKKQCYFIVYGSKLVCQRSYFGTMAVTKSVTKAKDIFAQIVYDGDEFQFEINRGRKKVIKHIQTLQSLSGGKIVAAYCTIIFDEERDFTEIMTMDEIHQSWKKSKQNPDKEGSTHSEFPGEMAKRTVTNRACKSYLNSSNDSNLVLKHFQRQDDALVEAEVEEEIQQNANGAVIDVEWTDSNSKEPEQKSDPVQEVKQPHEQHAKQSTQPQQKTLDDVLDGKVPF